MQVVNLLVTPEQAEILSLASNETRIQLVLRNPLDTRRPRFPGAAWPMLFGGPKVAARRDRARLPLSRVSRRAAQGHSPASAATPCDRSHQWSSPHRSQFARPLKRKKVNLKRTNLIANRLPSPIMLTLAFAAVFGMLPAAAQNTRELVLTVGKSLVVNSAANIERVAVGFGDIAEARAVGPKEVLHRRQGGRRNQPDHLAGGRQQAFFDVACAPTPTAARPRSTPAPGDAGAIAGTEHQRHWLKTTLSF